jgi:hypothetical protein
LSGSPSSDIRDRPLGPITGTAWIVVFLIGARPAGGAGPPLWGGLKPGPHAVGFRSTWELDYSRVYDTTFEDRSRYATGKAPRPVLVNLWYPAERSDDARPMPHGGYFEIGTDGPRLGKLASKLANYNREIVRKELFDKDAAALSERERRLLERLWATPTACTRDARRWTPRSRWITIRRAGEAAAETLFQ